ncbi:MAG: anti-sigma factor [Dehalococcoidia bacterium]
MNCDQVNEALGAYAVDALPPEERREVESHLRECGRHEEAVALRATASLLAYAPEDRDPPVRLRSRILAAVAEADASAAEESRAPIPLAARRRRPPSALLAAVIALFALGAVITGFFVLGPGGGSEDLVRTVASGPAAGTTLRYDAATDRATLDVAGLADLPAGRVYQVWMLRGEQVAGVGLFSVDASGRGNTTFDASLEEGDTIAVTEEPAGGSPAPTSQPLFAIQL